MALAYLCVDIFQKMDAGGEKVLTALERHKTMKIERPVLVWWSIPLRRPFELADAIATRLADDRIDPGSLLSWGSRVISQVLQDLKLLCNIALIAHKK
jgi:hypothetical protein